MERTLKEINPNRNKTDIFRQIAREALEEEGEKITHKAVQKKADAIKRKFYREQKDTDGFPYPFKHLKREISS